MHMEIELLSAVSLLPETFGVLIAPADVLAGALNSRIDLQRLQLTPGRARSSVFCPLVLEGLGLLQGHVRLSLQPLRPPASRGCTGSLLQGLMPFT